MRVPELCLYFPLILFGSLVAVAYFTRPRVSLLRPGYFRPRPFLGLFVFFRFVVFYLG